MVSIECATARKCQAGRPKKSRRSTADSSRLPALTEYFDQSTRKASFSPARKGTAAGEAACGTGRGGGGRRAVRWPPREPLVRASVPSNAAQASAAVGKRRRPQHVRRGSRVIYAAGSTRARYPVFSLKRSGIAALLVRVSRPRTTKRGQERCYGSLSEMRTGCHDYLASCCERGRLQVAAGHGARKPGQENGADSGGGSPRCAIW